MYFRTRSPREEGSPMTASSAEDQPQQKDNRHLKVKEDNRTPERFWPLLKETDKSSWAETRDFRSKRS
jgi:hypothetical protein